MKKVLKTPTGIRKPQIGYCVQIKARIDDREGEILRKNQQWTMDSLLVYVEYCISTMSESEIFESKKY